MELRHLRYFVAVAEEENVTRAAAKLYVSQPALSRQIRDLENELDLLLFQRGAKTVRLTAAGRIFLIEAKAVLERAEAAIRNVHEAAGGLNGEIHVGYSPSLTVQILPRALRVFQEKFPAVRVTLHDLSNGEMMTGLRDGQLHLALTAQRERAAGLESRLIESYELNVAVPPSHPLAQAGVITLHQLAAERIIGYTRKNYPGYYAHLGQLFGTIGKKPNIVEEHESVSSLMAAVEASRGVSLVPSCIACMAGPRLTLLTIDPPQPEIAVSAIHLEGVLPAVVKNFIAAAQSEPSEKLVVRESRLTSAARRR